MFHSQGNIWHTYIVCIVWGKERELQCMPSTNLHDHMVIILWNNCRLLYEAERIWKLIKIVTILSLFLRIYSRKQKTITFKTNSTLVLLWKCSIFTFWWVSTKMLLHWLVDTKWIMLLTQLFLLQKQQNLTYNHNDDSTYSTKITCRV